MMGISVGWLNAPDTQTMEGRGERTSGLTGLATSEPLVINTLDSPIIRGVTLVPVGVHLQQNQNHHAYLY
jgi:hypothetical protein